MNRGRPMVIDLERFARMHARGLSDGAIARVFACDRKTVWNYRKRLGLPARRWVPPGRRAQMRARHAELDAIWARLTIEEKTLLLLNR